jgi:hypothetical protein
MNKWFCLIHELEAWSLAFMTVFGEAEAGYFSKSDGVVQLGAGRYTAEIFQFIWRRDIVISAPQRISDQCHMPCPRYQPQRLPRMATAHGGTAGLPASRATPVTNGGQLLRIEDRDHSGCHPGVSGPSDTRSSVKCLTPKVLVYPLFLLNLEQERLFLRK